MTRALPRTHFNSSRLTRFLTENAMLDAVQTQQEVGQQLGDWLNFRQAIALHGLLNPEQATAHDAPAHLRRTPIMSAEALCRHVDKVRAQLEQSITQGAPTGSGLARIDMPPHTLDEPVEPKTAYEPYRRFHAAHQRQMESTLRSLRSQVRGQLNQCMGPLQQLASAFLRERRFALQPGRQAAWLREQGAPSLGRLRPVTGSARGTGRGCHR